MTDHAVIQGTFSDLRTVKTRKVVQMVVEVPIEQGKRIIDAFGFPQPQSEVFVAVARLDMGNTHAQSNAPEKPRKRFHELPYSQQAALRCREPRFWKYICERYGWGADNEEDAANFVRTHCTVNSRKDLDGEDPSFVRDNWRDLNSDFEQWAGLVPQAS